MSLARACTAPTRTTPLWRCCLRSTICDRHRRALQSRLLHVRYGSTRSTAPRAAWHHARHRTTVARHRARFGNEHGTFFHCRTRRTGILGQLRLMQVRSAHFTALAVAPSSRRI
ncbi:hypothetical protein AMAG_18978 [Allomyces macrogynus ATCC 38327]|uniref:Uncharacterized protein n=1 Tax=Allomyces macrogynus (strain ATCC 38327) TaxID=578462 RepID=A0A0L0SLE3_ALLM3|nr:hypothetical protein AMAG_18978 [Allomyces macrogynus ATCC 38327]|eukprot:KNE63258.1 hypothetical protein AMAG_18978 [Allomyces macrogynus ATCC 38327]